MAAENQEVYSLFYERLKEARDYHRRHPDLELASVDKDEEEFLKSRPRVDFSGEEAQGRFLDLHDVHRSFTNAPKFGNKDLSYLDFLGMFCDFRSIPKPSKLNQEYKAYLEDLDEYLVGFYGRSQPLASLGAPLAAVEKEFDEMWERGEVEDWEDKGLGASTSQVKDNPKLIDLEDFESAGDLEAVGGDRIKEALVALGLKAGGSLSQKAERLMATKGKALEELDRKLFAKGKKPVRNAEEAQRRLSLSKAIALLECRIRALMQLMEKTLSDTKKQVEKKATSTYEELVADMEELQDRGQGDDQGGDGTDNEDDENDNIIYNPLNIPVGFDGKPIPYWLYKLHGLNQEFKCEICGNFSYWGRRAFEKHFNEARHLHGMKCLGIPNSKIFSEVTKIDEAYALWENMKKKNSAVGFTQDEDEEFEDADGNVYNKKTYIDLQRQGLL
uniref:Matrin-type domain-containing protein n=2 Tax=Chloropicon primus TaxID=1764295 RepID=A0A7S2SXV1_9CHLO